MFFVIFVFFVRNFGTEDAISHLRAATRESHARVESLTGLAEASLTRDRYRRVLRAFFAVYRPLEGGLSRVGPLPVEFSPRLPLIAADLDYLGDDAAGVDDSPDVPAVNDPASAAGAQYVVEGASLGAKLLAPMLAERLGLTANDGAAFFAAGAGSAGTRWAAFCKRLPQIVDTPEAIRLAASAADATFAALERAVADELSDV